MADRGIINSVAALNAAPEPILSSMRLDQRTGGVAVRDVGSYWMAAGHPAPPPVRQTQDDGTVPTLNTFSSSLFPYERRVDVL